MPESEEGQTHYYGDGCPEHPAESECESCALLLREQKRGIASLLPVPDVRAFWLARYHAEGHPYDDVKAVLTTQENAEPDA